MPAHQQTIGNRIAPARFVAFGLSAAVAVPAAIALTDWARGTMIGFDIAAAVFLIACLPLLKRADPAAMRLLARQNDANRLVMLAIAALAMLAVLAAVAAELSGRGRADPWVLALVLTTLVLAWLFGNSVYALHYAHEYYLPDDDGGDCRGLAFPKTEEPSYPEFVYFAFTLGMTFQTSDVDVETTRLRNLVLTHSAVAFVFNLGVIAFTINVLGGG